MPDVPHHSVLDPTGNVTALVEDPVPVADQPLVAARIMEARPDVEQVGFVSAPCPGDDRVDTCLRMAGGEFCGNATMSAAFLCALRGGRGAGTVMVASSGSPVPVEVRVSAVDGSSCEAAVLMPAAQDIEEVPLSWGGVSAKLPVVRLGGIDHVVVPEESAFFELASRCGDAAGAVRSWCAELGSSGLGLMFLEGTGLGRRRLVPLVYVPGAGTTFWESSCASGSSAVGMWLARRTGAPVDVGLAQPGGTLRVTSDPTTGETWLHGRVRLMA